MRRLRNEKACASGQLAVAIGCILSLAGCIDTSAGRPLTRTSYCEENAEVDCRVYWDCWATAMRDEVRAQLAAKGVDIGQNRSECTTNLKAVCATAPFACAMGMTFQELKAGACIDGKESLSCADWLNGGGDTIRACDTVCTRSTLNP